MQTQIGRAYTCDAIGAGGTAIAKGDARTISSSRSGQHAVADYSERYGSTILPAPTRPGFECIIEGYREVPGARIEVQRHRWTQPQEATLVTSGLLVLLSLPRNAPRARGLFSEARGDPQPYGKLMVVPPEQPLEGSWDVGDMRSACCLLDAETLIGPDHALDDPDLGAALDLRNPLVIEIMKRLAQEAVAPSHAGELLIESLARALVIEVHNSLRRDGGRRPDHDPDRATAALDRASLHRIDARIRAEGSTLPTIAELADLCDMHPRRFERAFKAATGQSVARYVTRQRLTAAQAALMEPNARVKSIAYRAGFQSVSAFSSAFRREIGVTPVQYRRSLVG
jgi:AraC family transcriptional regulator